MATPAVGNSNTNSQNVYNSSNSSPKYGENQATTSYKPPLDSARRDARVLATEIGLTHIAMEHGNRLVRTQALPWTRNGFKNLTTLTQGSKIIKTLGKYSLPFSAAIGAMDASEAVRQDRTAGDQYYSKTTKSVLGTLGNVALATTATVSLMAVASVALPAALIIGAGAGLLGQEIRETLGAGITAAWKIWDNWS